MLSCTNDDFTGDVVNEEMKNLVHKKLTYHEVHEILALNYSGVVIPNIPSTNTILGTVQGADGKYYFLNAKALNIWMRKTFGVSPVNSNHIRLTPQDGGSEGENLTIQ